VVGQNSNTDYAAERREAYKGSELGVDCRRDARRTRRVGMCRMRVEIILFEGDPPYAKREQRFSAEGRRKPKLVRGERSQGRSVRRGTRYAQARFWERGRSGRKPYGTPEGILYAAGEHPLYLHQGYGGFSPVYSRDRSEAQPGEARSAGTPRRPKEGMAEGNASVP
jgi:hypothetical protein